MARSISRLPVLLAFLLAAGSPVGGHDDGPQAHGVFTGQIKAVLYVSDVEASVPFYRDVLGFDFEGFAGPEGEPYYAEMAAAGVKFGLHEPTSGDQKGKVGRQRIYFRVENLGAHRARVLAREGQAGQIRITGWMDMFIVRDPDGNEIVFAVTDPDRHTSDPWSTGESGARGD